MQKLPKFGERLSCYDQSREEASYAKYTEFIQRGSEKPPPNICEIAFDSCAIQVLNTKTSLIHSYGLSYNSSFYLSPEEAFFLSTRKLINTNALSLLHETPIFIHKILIFSYFKRKNFSTPPLPSSLPNTLQTYTGRPTKLLSQNQEILIKNPDDQVDLSQKSCFISDFSSYEKLTITPWVP